RRRGWRALGQYLCADFPLRWTALPSRSRAEWHVVLLAGHGERRARSRGCGNALRLVRCRSESRRFLRRASPRIETKTCRDTHAWNRSEWFGTLVWLWAAAMRRIRRARFDVRASGGTAGRRLGRDHYNTGRLRVDPQPEQTLPKAARSNAPSPRKIGHRIQYLLWRPDRRPRRISYGPNRQGGSPPPPGQLDCDRSATGAAHRHDQRRTRRSRGVAVDCTDRCWRGPLAGLR